MKCVDPFVRAGEAFPCGRCLPCKFRKRREWFTRVMLEASQHGSNSVVTLTYDEAALPETGELQPAHLRDWLKRYRKRQLEEYPWRRVRFIACGEYGEKSGRPHYHVVLFGIPGCEEGRGGRSWCSDCGCRSCQVITETWTVGQCSVDELTAASAAYVAGYVTRKVISAGYGTKCRPFMRMSNGGRTGRGGIGASAMHDVASTVLQYDLPVSRFMVGRYLRRKLSEYSDRAVPAFEQSDAMRAVFAYAWDHSRSVRSVVREINEPYSSQMAQKEAAREKVL